MLSEHHQAGILLGEGLSDEAGVIVEGPNIALISSVEQNATLAWVIVLIVQQISHLESGEVLVRSSFHDGGVTLAGKVVNLHCIVQLLGSR